MSFLRNYLKYNEGNECPDMYHVWAGLTILGIVVGPKVYYDHKFFKVFCNLYVCLVGEQGDRKSVAKDIAHDMLQVLKKQGKINPVISAECDTKEGIAKFMTQPEQLRTFKRANGEVVGYQPYHIFANELKLYIAVNPSGMVDFLTSIYDRTERGHSARTKNKGFDDISNPYVTFLVCETPKWLVERLKESIISGGFCRRLVFVYSTESKPRIAFPFISPQAQEAYLACLAWLDKIKDIEGEFKLTPEAAKWYENWYVNLPTSDNEFMRGWGKSLHIQLFKVGMLIALGEGESLLLTVPILEAALELLTQVGKNLPKLVETIGRNELAFSAHMLMEIVTNNKGVVTEKKLRADTYNNLQTGEFFSVLQHLISIDKLAKISRDLNGVKQIVYLTPEKFKELQEATKKEK